MVYYNANQAGFKQESGQSREQRALWLPCFWNLPAASKLVQISLCFLLIKGVWEMSALPCSTLHRPLQFPPPPTVSSDLSSCYKANPRHTPAGCHLTPTLQGPEGGAAGRRSLSNSVFLWLPCSSAIASLLRVPVQQGQLSLHSVSAQSDQGVSWQSKECLKGKHLAGSMPCCSESWEEGIALNSLLGSYKNKCTEPAPGSS